MTSVLLIGLTGGIGSGKSTVAGMQVALRADTPVTVKPAKGKL